MTRPAVVFGDEPTGNLDSVASREILELIAHAVDDLGQTIVMVTHDPRPPPSPTASSTSPTALSPARASTRRSTRSSTT